MERENNHFYLLKWTHLFIISLIPATMIVYTVLENNREYTLASRNHAEILVIDNNQQSNIIFHEYQKTLSNLIEKYGLQLNESASASFAARFAILSTLRRLDSDGQHFLIHLLYDTKLITYHSISDQPIISLESANLTGLCLINEFIRQTLIHISMIGTIMTKADFHGMNINGAMFNRTILNHADFSNTTNIWLCDNLNCISPYNPTIYFDSS